MAPGGCAVPNNINWFRVLDTSLPGRQILPRTGGFGVREFAWWHLCCSPKAVHKTAKPDTTVLRQTAAKIAADREPRQCRSGLRKLSIAAVFATALSLLLPFTTFAEGPVLTLAMVKPGDLLKRQFQPLKERLGVGAPRATQPQPAAPSVDSRRLMLTEKIILSLNVPLEKRSDSEPGSSVMLTRTNLRELGLSRMWASLEAGYGQFFSDKGPMIYGRNGARWEEPSCGYLKITFSF